MIANLLTKLFQKRCPICKAKLEEGAEEVIHRFGKRFCSQAHADRYAWRRALAKAIDRTGCGGSAC